MCPKTSKEKEEMANMLYLSVIGSLLYVVLSTRPNINQKVGLLARYSSNPRLQHQKSVKRALRYLKGTKNYWLCYYCTILHLYGYSNADCGGDEDFCKFTSGYVFILNSGVITWCSKKQICTTLSIIEVEFISNASAVQEALRFGYFLKKLESKVLLERPITIFIDSMMVIAYIIDLKYHRKTK